MLKYAIVSTLSNDADADADESCPVMAPIHDEKLNLAGRIFLDTKSAQTNNNYNTNHLNTKTCAQFSSSWPWLQLVRVRCPLRCASVAATPPFPLLVSISSIDPTIRRHRRRIGAGLDLVSRTD